jgi:integrase
MRIELREGNRYVGKFSTKTKSSNRIIPITKELHRILKEEIYLRKHGYVFVSQKGGKYSVRSIIRIVNKYAKMVSSLERTIGSHALRTTYASYLLSNGVKIGKISKLLGHASVKTTMLYLYDIVDKSDFDEIRDTISEMNKL